MRHRIPNTLRDARGRTPRGTLARVAGVDPRTVDRVEREFLDVRLSTALRIAAALRTTLDVLWPQPPALTGTERAAPDTGPREPLSVGRDPEPVPDGLVDALDTLQAIAAAGPEAAARAYFLDQYGREPHPAELRAVVEVFDRAERTGGTHDVE